MPREYLHIYSNNINNNNNYTLQVACHLFSPFWQASSDAGLDVLAPRQLSLTGGRQKEFTTLYEGLCVLEVLICIRVVTRSSPLPLASKEISHRVLAKIHTQECQVIVFNLLQTEQVLDQAKG